MNKFLLILALLSISLSQQLESGNDVNMKTPPAAFQDGAYEYKNYAVTFENLYDYQEFEYLANWKVVGDSISKRGDWKTKMDELKLEGWEVSRAVPGEWNTTANFTIIYELQRLKKQDLNKPQKERKQ